MSKHKEHPSKSSWFLLSLVLVSDHQPQRATTSSLSGSNELDNDQSSECSSTLTPDSNSRVSLFKLCVNNKEKVLY